MRLVIQNPDNSLPALFIVYYVDITDLVRFTNSINFLLISLVGSIWLMSVVVTTVLAGTLVRPLRYLGRFAERIGRGDFSPSDTVFHEIEFQNLSQSLNRTARQLTQYDNEQKTFVQNVSHELRTPLMSIKCYAEGIQYGLMPPEKASKTILEETDRLSDLVDDILYISRIDNITPASTYERVDLRRVVENCVNQQRVVAENRNVIIIVDNDDKPVTVSCVAKQVTRAVNNLISNAIRYAAAAVTVSCRTASGTAIITVTDDGPGISPEILPRVFERFHKGEGGHNGIGLSIVKSVAEQHRGSVTAENNETGAAFTITLPIK
jgi:signal transduction histidine kinase